MGPYDRFKLPMPAWAGSAVLGTGLLARIAAPEAGAELFPELKGKGARFLRQVGKAAFRADNAGGEQSIGGTGLRCV